ncbi:hypothetical protein CRE_24744 [Caenorhabditis remanei]|uniref:Sdz-33 F-box domain-containing protein n=1 Tax=Caenorhabditis remanei TaxID=31234 RepID=E3N962_CAERE|nr:hypothetical protein CRE_24744 [Caenorhabditis remanei]
MSSPFPLLRLPRLALFNMSTISRIMLSLCSKKTAIHINNDRLYSQKVIVSLDMINQGIRVHTKNYKDKFDIFIYPDTWSSDISNTQQFYISCCITGINTFWKNQQEGFLSFISHLLKMFRCKITTTFSCCDSDSFQQTILMFFDLQLEFKTLCILFDGSKYQNLWNQISSNLGLVEDLQIFFDNMNSGFTPVFTSWPTKEISIFGCNWFTLESLLSCTCSSITLEESRLRYKDLNEILRKWMTGGFPNLKYLRIQRLRRTDDGEHILGMDWRDLNGMVIQTDDGSKKATINNGAGGIEISVTPFE